MSVQRVPSSYSFAFSFLGIDTEEKEIMHRLLSYGVTPTGDKATDKATLKRIEHEKAKEDGVVSNKYLTVSTAEQEKFQAQKKERKKEAGLDPEMKKLYDKRLGANILGQQIYFAIKQKNNDKK